MSPETRRPRRKHARADPEPEVRELRRMYIKGIMRILRWGHQQGRPSFTLEQLESEFSKLLGKPFNLATIQQPDMARFLGKYPSKMQVYSDEGVTKVRISDKEVEWVREQIRKGESCTKPWTWGHSVSPTPAPSPRRGASPDASLLPTVASSSQLESEGRSAASCARTSTAAGSVSSVQPRPTAPAGPAANLVPSPRWAAASALPKPPAASSSTPQSSAPSEAAQVGERDRPRHVVLTLRRRTGLAHGRSSADDLQPDRKSTAARRSASLPAVRAAAYFDAASRPARTRTGSGPEL